MKICNLLPLCLIVSTFIYGQATEDTIQKAPYGVTQVTPVEDLMREHGVVNRALLIYEELFKRISAGKIDDAELLKKTATIIRTFIENYHETLEEVYIFPKFEKVGFMVDIVTTLRRQHIQGRECTDFIIAHANATDLQDPAMQEKICATIKKHIAMYRPHSAREDTVLFPAFKALVTEEEYKSLGELFEDREHGLFGKAGFTSIVESIASIERALGIYNLAQFDPKP